MTPPARVAAAIDILDKYLSGLALEKVLTTWARSNRYAGSGDRAAIRDLVFSAVRCQRSYAFLGNAETGRGLMIGLCRAKNIDLDSVFTGAKYAPPALETSEKSVPDITSAPIAVQHDCPDWLLPVFEESLGNDTLPILKNLQSRAPVFLRVNSAKTDRKTVADLLAAEGIVTCEHPLSPTALEVLENPRRVAQTAAYLDGLIELQDVASQSIADQLLVTQETTVLDYCAGGGGKSLAIAAHGVASITAHDTFQQRMNDLPARATRAGAAIVVVETDELKGNTFDLVLCDVPCSGNGSWRRSPEAKWMLTSERLIELIKTQSDILESCMKYVSDTGVLAYATCSLFRQENEQQITAFLARHPDWRLVSQNLLSPLEGGDGFFLARLTRA